MSRKKSNLVANKSSGVSEESGSELSAMQKLCAKEAAACIIDDLRKAIDADDLRSAYRLMHLIGGLSYPHTKSSHQSSDPLFRTITTLVRENEFFLQQQQQVNRMRTQWLKSLKANDKVDFFKLDERRWYQIKLIEFIGEDQTTVPQYLLDKFHNSRAAESFNAITDAVNDATTADDVIAAAADTTATSTATAMNRAVPDVHVHFMGWSIIYDELLVLSEELIAPQKTFTVTASELSEEIMKTTPFAAVLDEKQSTSTAQPTTTTTAAQTTTAVAVVKSESTASAVAVEGKRRRTAVASYAEKPSATAETTAATTAIATTAAAEGKSRAERDINEWICGICGHLEDTEDSHLILCEGPCLRSFHSSCLKAAEKSKQKQQQKQQQQQLLDDSQWRCDDCKRGCHECFICKQYGADHREVAKCSTAACGKFYHRTCLEAGEGAEGDFIAPKVEVAYYDTVNSVVVKSLPKSVLQLAKTTTTSVDSTKETLRSADATADAVATATALDDPTITSCDITIAVATDATEMSVITSNDAVAKTTSTAATNSDMSSLTHCSKPSTRGKRTDYKAMVQSPRLWLLATTASKQSPPTTTTTATVAATSVANDAVISINNNSRRNKQTAAAAAAAVIDEAFIQSNGRFITTFKFRCPRHHCHNCYEFYGSVDNNDLNPCVLCPRAFHTRCIYPGARYNSVCLLCPLHPEAPLPARKNATADAFAATATATATSDGYPISNSSTVNGELSAAIITQFWDQLAIPEEEPDESDVFGNHFRLQQHVKNSHKVLQVPEYQNIANNDYSFMKGKTMPKAFNSGVRCDCSERCDHHCLNRLLRFECVNKKCPRGSNNRSSNNNSSNSNSSGSNSSGEIDWNICNVGGSCGNRAIQERKYAQSSIFFENDMGWGLRADEYIPSGEFVIEYIGEIIDAAEVHRRMGNQRKYSPTDKDFYIMELNGGLFVDGKLKGNKSRFINHSCDPNCELQRWVVGDRMCIGIFALKDIAAKEALSYDYQFDTNEADIFKCFCGSDNCRGTMAPAQRDNRSGGLEEVLRSDAVDLDALTADTRKQLVSIGRENERLGQQPGSCSEELRLRCYTGKFHPGDAVNEIRNGPMRATFALAKQRQLFLARNVQRGGDLLLRSALMFAPQKQRQTTLLQQQQQKKSRSRVATTTTTVATTSYEAADCSGNGRSNSGVIDSSGTKRSRSPVKQSANSAVKTAKRSKLG